MLIVVVEAGVDYTDRREAFELKISGSDERLVEQAMAAVAAKGYRVMRDEDGGCNECVSVSGGEDYVAVTVYPK